MSNVTQIPTQSDLVRQIDAFLLRHDMKPSRLSREATGEPSLVEAIRNGRSPTLATVEKLMKVMAEIDAAAALRAKLEAPLDGPAPEEVEQPLPFSPAPVNPTGASSATSSSTSEPRTSSAANGSCPSCSSPDRETAGSISLSPGTTGRRAPMTPGASSFSGCEE